MRRITVPHTLLPVALLLASLFQEDHSFVISRPTTCPCHDSLPQLVRNDEYLVDADKLEKYIGCCDHHLCNSESTQLLDSLQVWIEYTSISKAFVITEWNASSVSGPVHIEVKQNDIGACFSVPSSTINKLTVEVRSPPLPSYYRCVTQAHNISVTVNSQQRVVEIRDCLNMYTHNATARCSPTIAEAPTNVSADVSLIGGGRANVTIHWDPPTSVIDQYMLSIIGNTYEDKSLSGNVTEYNTVLSNVSSESPTLVRVRSGVNIPGDNPCCGCITRGSIVFGRSAEINISVPVEPIERALFTTTGLPHAVAWPIALFVVLVAGSVLITFLRVLYIRRKNKLKENVSVLPGDAIDPDTVFLAASTEEDAGVKRRIRNLCHVLADHGLTPVYYEYVENDHSEDSPLAMGMNRWVELQFSRCEFVLFVCTKRFLEEWNGERRDILSPLVYPCRHLLDGSLTRPQNISRFAVLFMGEDKCVPPGLLRLHRFNITDPKGDRLLSNKLMNYVTNKPLFMKYINFFKHYC